MKDQVTMAAWGGGVNSTAMIIEWLAQSRRLDLVLFADTGGEKPETYEHRDRFADWLRGKVPFVSVQGSYKFDTLEEECLKSKTLPSLAYGFKRCSLKWKRDPQNKWVRNHWPAAREAWDRGEQVLKLIGYDAGEGRRAKIHADKGYDYAYPLIEWEMDRAACIQRIKDEGLEVPGKSSCFFCPASKTGDILDLARDYPDLMKRALAIEDNAELTSVEGLGRRFSWRKFLNQEVRQDRLFEAEQLPCECMD